MRGLLRLLIGLVGLFNLLIGLSFFLRPAQLAEKFFLIPQGAQGLATIRADFTAFFVTASLCALWGAWRAEARPLLVPILLLAIALSGRCLGIVADGISETTLPPMAVEAIMVAILVAGYRNFGRRGLP